MKRPALPSPYLADDRRLSDVIAAIQTAGTYKFYKLDFATWADRISGDTNQEAHWRRVFEEHPEFFRLDSERKRGSLVLRRQRQRLYNVDENAEWTRTRYDSTPNVNPSRFSRLPLSPAEIEALIDVAINLHTRATERARDKRWWIPLISAFAGALLGGVIPKLIDVLTATPPS